MELIKKEKEKQRIRKCQNGFSLAANVKNLMVSTQKDLKKKKKNWQENIKTMHAFCHRLFNRCYNTYKHEQLILVIIKPTKIYSTAIFTPSFLIVKSYPGECRIHYAEILHKIATVGKKMIIK